MERFTLSSLKNKNFSKAVSEIYLLTDYNHLQYPDYYKWFYTKSIPRIFTKTGDIIFYLNGFDIIGLTILKKTEEEKKICTFLINEEYRKKGYSKQLMEDSFTYLETDKPIITIPKIRLEEFSKIITAYDFKETSKTNDYFSEEVIFNDFTKKLK